MSSNSTSSSQRDRKSRGGRTSTNWKSHNVDLLLELVKKHLPVGSDDWRHVTLQYNRIANDTCNQSRVENKFKSLANAKKDTGNAVMSRQIRWAKHIDLMINNKAGAHIEGEPIDDDNHDDDIYSTLLDASIDDLNTPVVDSSGESQSQSQSQHAELLIQHPLPSVHTDDNGNSIDNTSATVSSNSSTAITPTNHTARKRSSMDIISTTVEKIANKEDNDKSDIKQILAGSTRQIMSIT